MGHESQIELWSPNLTTFCFAGFGTDRLRCQEAMKTAGRKNPKRWATVPSNRALGAVGQNSSRSIRWAAKQEKFQPKEKCFFLTSTFIELIRRWRISLRNGDNVRQLKCLVPEGVLRAVEAYAPPDSSTSSSLGIPRCRGFATRREASAANTYAPNNAPKPFQK
jgi:hypothetical protein